MCYAYLVGMLQLELIREDEIVKNCPFCGWSDDEVYLEVSRHHTRSGQTVWTRCACGSLQVRVVEVTGTRIVARGRPEVDAGALGRVERQAC